MTQVIKLDKSTWLISENNKAWMTSDLKKVLQIALVLLICSEIDKNYFDSLFNKLD